MSVLAYISDKEKDGIGVGSFMWPTCVTHHQRAARLPNRADPTPLPLEKPILRNVLSRFLNLDFS
jgi:hypothetical protein